MNKKNCYRLFFFLLVICYGHIFANPTQVLNELKQLHGQLYRNHLFLNSQFYKEMQNFIGKLPHKVGNFSTNEMIDLVTLMNKISIQLPINLASLIRDNFRQNFPNNEQKVAFTLQYAKNGLDAALLNDLPESMPPKKVVEWLYAEVLINVGQFSPLRFDLTEKKRQLMLSLLQNIFSGPINSLPPSSKQQLTLAYNFLKTYYASSFQAIDGQIHFSTKEIRELGQDSHPSHQQEQIQNDLMRILSPLGLKVSQEIFVPQLASHGDLLVDFNHNCYFLMEFDGPHHHYLGNPRQNKPTHILKNLLFKTFFPRNFASVTYSEWNQLERCSLHTRVQFLLDKIQSVVFLDPAKLLQDVTHGPNTGDTCF